MTGQGGDPEVISHDVVTAIRESRLVVIVRRAAVEDYVADALCSTGIRIVEISLAAGDATRAISRWRERFDELIVGAGTVTTASEAAQAIDAGASFLISPGNHADVGERAAAAGVPYIPGALTPTEIHACATGGAELIKLFPAARLGPQYIRDVLAPFPDLSLIPTGGVDASNARAFLEAGAAAVAVGGALIGATKGRDEIREDAKLLIDIIASSPRGGA